MYLEFEPGDIIDTEYLYRVETEVPTKRMNFLENYIKIVEFEFRLNTYPQVLSITFDKDMKYARIEFKVINEGGYAILERDRERWKLISSKVIWKEMWL